MYSFFLNTFLLTTLPHTASFILLSIRNFFPLSSLLKGLKHVITTWCELRWIRRVWKIFKTLIHNLFSCCMVSVSVRHTYSVMLTGESWITQILHSTFLTSCTIYIPAKATHIFPCYCLFILRWASTCFLPSPLKNWILAHCVSHMRASTGAAILDLVLLVLFFQIS